VKPTNAGERIAGSDEIRGSSRADGTIEERHWYTSSGGRKPSKKPAAKNVSFAAGFFFAGELKIILK